MKKITFTFITSLFLLAAAMMSVSTAPAQTKDGDKAKHDKKYVVRVLTIEDGDTTVSDHAIDDGDEGDEFTVMVGDDTDDDPDMKEDMTVEVLGKKKYNDYVLQSGKEGGPINIFVRKKSGGRGDKDCGGGSCCMMGKKEKMHGKMDKEEMMKMHGKMDKEEMMKMHEKMSREEMERMHGKMGKMHDDDDDEDEADDSGSESDDDDGGNLR